MDTLNDKLSIKNLLFSKAIPNYIITVPLDGHTVYSCIDCGDKFILQSSYEYHLNRKSLKISYMCRHCGTLKFFYNRCNLLCHIRSHAFKTATINVTDLKIEPLPLCQFNITMPIVDEPSSLLLPVDNIRKQKSNKTVCYECKKDITSTGTQYKDRVKHCMQYTNEAHSCPVCLFTLPTVCGLRMHMRLHLKCPPYYCPECGIQLFNKSIHYPYNHDCEGFKMMRVTVRQKCPIENCLLFHPNEIKNHLKNSHLKKVFKCPYCYVACFNEPIIKKHLLMHKTDSKSLIFYQCEMCPGRLVLQNQVDNHLRSHINNIIYPCWSCGATFKTIYTLIEHHVKKHDAPADLIQTPFNSIIRDSGPEKSNKIYRVVKRCDQCKRNFTYKCNFEQIRMLPNVCPYNCTSKQANTDDVQEQIICHLCKNNISINWEDIKKHYNIHHKVHRCIDLKVVLEKLDLRRIMKKKRRSKVKNNTSERKRNKNTNVQNEKKSDLIDTIPDKITVVSPSSGDNDNNELFCSKCSYVCENKNLLETHMVSHRDPCMAYQCMECGQSFVVKPSFSTHLLLEHGISDVQEYIDKKQCYNESALMKYQHRPDSYDPVRENQCTICREQFNSHDDLKKHFRVHGMAFLMKNNTIKNSSP